MTSDATADEPAVGGTAPTADQPAKKGGSLPEIIVAGNPVALPVAESLRTGIEPERISPLFAPPPFDAVAYAKDPESYCAQAVPGRVFQSAQPELGVKRLRRTSPALVEVKQNEPIILSVLATPGAPVSYNSFDCGIFSNGMPAITVRADEEGIARATYTATRGVTDDVNILAASPVTAGTVRFLISIVLV